MHRESVCKFNASSVFLTGLEKPDALKRIQRIIVVSLSAMRFLRMALC